MRKRLVSKLHETLEYDSLEEFLQERYGGDPISSMVGVENLIVAKSSQNNLSRTIQLVNIDEDSNTENVRGEIMRYLFERGYTPEPTFDLGGSYRMFNEFLGRGLKILVTVEKRNLGVRITASDSCS